jgi:hypothetical protein
VISACNEMRIFMLEKCVNENKWEKFREKLDQTFNTLIVDTCRN